MNRGNSSARRGGASSSRRRRRQEESKREDSEFIVPETRVVVPDDQVQLSETELDESVPRVLTANDPNVPNSLVCYSFHEGSFKPLPSSAENEHVAWHVRLDGSLLHPESDEAAAQLSHERSIRRNLAEKRRELEKQAMEDGKEMEELEEELGSIGGRNQFNYSERAAQTYTSGMKQRAVTTRPPETAVFGSTVSQWDIYDTYVEEFERIVQQEALERGEQAPATSSGNAAGGKKAPKTGEAIVHSDSCGWSLKLLERITVQNAQDELYNDFKYWEDASDPHRVGGLGSLLPLWRFYDARIRKKMVTAIAWNQRYRDMFAVGYGSYDFMRQGSGLVCVYTLKNVGHPEYIFSVESGVMSLDWYFGNPALLAVGCYDGTVKVFDVRRKENRPLYAADVKSGKHTDPVWQVRWQPDDLGKDLSFLSISSDGRVASWVLSKNELQMETVMALKLVQSGDGGGGDGGAGGGGGGGGTGTTTGADGGDGDGGNGGGGGGGEGGLTGLAGGCCFDFNPFSEHLFLVGTEEGRIHKCSKSFSGQYLSTFEGHHMAVYSVRWNPWHERVFASCSADWTVKLWDHMCPQAAIMTFDLQNEVGDICWAPYSSTVFAAVTSNGKALVFDLSVNKHEQICEQKIVKKAKLTHVAFSEEAPLLLVGDSNGGVNSLKLSPNLRKVSKIPIPEVKKGETPPEPPTRLQVEAGKLNDILTTADVKASVPITQFDGKPAPTATANEEAAADAGDG